MQRIQIYKVHKPHITETSIALQFFQIEPLALILDVPLLEVYYVHQQQCSVTLVEDSTVHFLTRIVILIPINMSYQLLEPRQQQ